VTDKTRQLGLVVARGTAVTVVAPTDGTVSIENPFLHAQQEI
jgi:U6 snRNA-associated Sm-like protein LSm7